MVVPCKDKHHPIHLDFNRSMKRANVWVYTACAKQLAGTPTPEEELEMTILMINSFDKRSVTEYKAQRARKQKENEMARLEIALLVGAESKEFLANFTKQVDRMAELQGMSPVKAAGKMKMSAPVEDEDETEMMEDEDDDFAPAKKTSSKKMAASFEDDEEAEMEEQPEADEMMEDEEMEEPPKKAAAKAAPAKAASKAKKFTSVDANDACKERMARTGGAKGRAEVLAILKKNFKTESVANIDPKDYEKLIKLMKA